MKSLESTKSLVLIAVIACCGWVAFETREAWLGWFGHGSVAENGELPPEAKAPTKVIVSELAQKNLGVKSKSIQPSVYWKTIAIPGSVVDRPGVSDRGVVSPAAAVVSSIERVTGDTVQPGETLFTLRLISESLHLTQTDLFKSTQETQIAQEKLKRLDEIQKLGTESKFAVLEASNQVRRLEVAIKAYRQELLSRGFTPEQVNDVADGKFVRELKVVVPSGLTRKAISTSTANVGFEIQELKVELGQQVNAGQTLCVIANHRFLAIEGRAFRDETRLLERSVKDGWPVEVDFDEDALAGWPALDQTFFIHHIANSIDPTTRTFAFLLTLENQVRPVERDGRTQLLWRFRPGQKVRLLVRADRLENVFVVPADAVVQEGAEVFVFTQNANTFERRPVHLLLRDGRTAVLANDGSLLSGSFVAQSGAAQLNRMAKAGVTGGAPRGYHIHADGSLHKNEDEGK